MASPSIYRLRLHDLLAICVMGLLALGIIMVQSASMRVTGAAGWHWSDYGMRHILYVAIALATFFLVGRFDYRRLTVASRPGRGPAVLFMALATIACFIVLIPHVGVSVNGARRWLSLGFTRVQPSELGKWAVVVFVAWWLSVRPVRLETFLGFLVTLLPVGLICLLVVVEDFGTAALIALAAVVMLLAARAKTWHLATVIPPILAAGYWFVRHKEYRWKRLTAFWNPWANPESEGYHMIQSLMSFATGGLFGKGLGRGVQKLGYLPEDTTDFIFAVICEELGLFGAMLTIVLYLGILFVSWHAVRQAKDTFGKMLAFGIGITISLQALINIAVATVSMPTKGMSLPLVSFGGSGLVITSAALGLLYSVCRVAHETETAVAPADEPAAALAVQP